MITNTTNTDKLSHKDTCVNSLIARLKWHPPRDLDEKNIELNRLLSTCPKSKGGGIHQWLFIVARFLWRFPFELKGETILRCLREATRNCKRIVTEQELLNAVNNSSIESAAALKGPGSGSGRGKLPSRRGQALTEMLDHMEIDLEGLISKSPESYCHSFSPQKPLSFLYADHPLLCFVYVKERSGGIATSWDDPKLTPFPPLMVPNPLLGKSAYTTDGNLSERALANVGKRRYLVLDFDSGSKDEHAAIIWHLHKQWIKQDVTLRMVLDSGKRSLHSWFDVRHLDEKAIWKLCCQAYKLSACDSTFSKAQLVRVPNAIRPGECKRQQVYYFQP